jgi:hypothetical protein
MDSIVNAERAGAWNGYEGQHWTDHYEHWDGLVGGLNIPLFGAGPNLYTHVLLNASGPG